MTIKWLLSSFCLSKMTEVCATFCQKPYMKLHGQKRKILKAPNFDLILVSCCTVSSNTEIFCLSPISHLLSPDLLKLFAIFLFAGASDGVRTHDLRVITTDYYIMTGYNRNNFLVADSGQG